MNLRSPSSDKPRVVGYIRTNPSGGDSREEEDLPVQRSRIEAYALSRDWELVGFYTDEGISGIKGVSRPALDKLFDDARSNGNFEYVVVTKLSRFARSTVNFLSLSKKLNDHGVTLVSIRENIDPSTDTGRLMLILISDIAEWERDVIRDQINETRRVKWAEHRTFVGRPPYGYRWNKNTKQIEIDETQAKTYKRIVDMFLEQGMSCRAIAFQLKTEGILCRTRPFTDSGIRLMLKSPTYCGNLTVNTHYFGDGKCGPGSIKTKEEKPAEKHIQILMPPLISKSEWDRLQERQIANKAKIKQFNTNSDCWLKGVLYCGNCGGKIHLHNSSLRKDGTPYRYYTCFYAKATRKVLAFNEHEKCDLPFIRAETLEDLVWSHVLALLRSPSYRRRCTEFSASQGQSEQIRALESELAVLGHEMQRLEKGAFPVFYRSVSVVGERRFFPGRTAVMG